MSERWYERVSALMLTQENENKELEQRYFPQVEITDIDEMGNEIRSGFCNLLDKHGKSIYFKSEIGAINYAIKCRDKHNSY